MKPLVLSAVAVFTFRKRPPARRRRAGALEGKSLLELPYGRQETGRPAYKEVAPSTARKDAEAYLVKKIKEGSTGVGGPIPMPPNGTVSDDDAKTLAKYILTIK